MHSLIKAIISQLISVLPKEWDAKKYSMVFSVITIIFVVGVQGWLVYHMLYEKKTSVDKEQIEDLKKTADEIKEQQQSQSHPPVDDKEVAVNKAEIQLLLEEVYESSIAKGCYMSVLWRYSNGDYYMGGEPIKKVTISQWYPENKLMKSINMRDLIHIPIDVFQKDTYKLWDNNKYIFYANQSQNAYETNRIMDIFEAKASFHMIIKGRNDMRIGVLVLHFNRDVKLTDIDIGLMESTCRKLSYKMDYYLKTNK